MDTRKLADAIAEQVEREGIATHEGTFDLDTTVEVMEGTCYATHHDYQTPFGDHPTFLYCRLCGDVRRIPTEVLHEDPRQRARAGARLPAGARGAGHRVRAEPHPGADRRRLSRHGAGAEPHRPAEGDPRVTMSPPRSGRRGDMLPSLARHAAEYPYEREHRASVSAPERALQTWAACESWFRSAWEASLPRRTHVIGVEDGSALGSPRMAGPMHARTDHASEQGWGVTGWDRDGQPRGVDRDSGLTRDPFLFHLECRLRSRVERERIGAQAVVRWAYLGWDLDEAAHTAFVKRIRLREEDPDGWAQYLAGHRSLIESTIRQLHHDCQREPVRHAICRECRRRDCICGQRSEAQANAESAA